MVVLRYSSLIYQLFDILIGITEALLRDIPRFRHLSGMAEIRKLFDLRIISSHFKRNAHTRSDVRSRVLDFQCNDRTEIAVSTVCRTIFLLTTEVA